MKLPTIENKGENVLRILKTLLACTLVACTAFAFLTVNVKAEESFDMVYEAEITKINNENGVSTPNSFVMYLSETDYMTADDWSEEEQNYKWYNAEDGLAEYENVDLLENNLCNFPLNKNLDELNFEQKIFINGVTLAQFKVENPYYFIGNMRQRIDTLAICFTKPVLVDGTIIEILEGCQFPTLSRACKDGALTSCIEVGETVKYERKDGVWVTYFEGYREGVEYDGDEASFKLSYETRYKNHNAVPLTTYSDAFIIYGDKLAGGVYKGLALASGSNTLKGYITVLRFVNPIDINEYEAINLRLYTNHARTINSYNDNNVTESTLGSALESFALDGAVHTTISLTSSLYADADGKVRTIVFKFNEDGEPFVNSDGEEVYDENDNLVRDQLFFVSFNLVKEKSSDLLTKDSLIIIENDDSFDVSFRFNKNCESWGESLNLSKVVLNGLPLSKVLSECKTAVAKWEKVGAMCQVVVTIPKSYTGKAQIKNAGKGYWGNSMGVLKGLKYPDGSEIDRNYTCHIYAAERILDSSFDADLEKTTVLGISYRYDAGSNNLRFSIRFDKKITSANYYHACEIERWRETDLFNSSSLYYDKGMSNVFVKSGFKSSLLDCVIINGKSIGDWHAYEATNYTNVQTHYGASGLEYMDVVFESHSALTYNPIAELVNNGSGITIEIKDGLRFMTNCQVKKTQTFILNDGRFSEVVSNREIHVYYDGSEVQNGSTVTVKTAVCPTSIFVTNATNYQVSHVTTDKTTVFTITYGDGQVFTFTVIEDSVAKPTTKPTTNTETEKKGCKSAVELPIVGITMILLASAIVLKERRSHE